MKQDITIYESAKKKRYKRKKVFRNRCEICGEWFETGYEKKTTHGARENYDCWVKQCNKRRAALYRKNKEVVNG